MIFSVILVALNFLYSTLIHRSSSKKISTLSPSQMTKLIEVNEKLISLLIGGSNNAKEDVEKSE